jgi:hypothetical protein
MCIYVRWVSNLLLSTNDSQQIMKPPKTIWVFRTSVSTRMDILRLKPLLDKLMQREDKWNFDLEDCDHILRFETRSTTASAIIAELEKAGYCCEELEDFISRPSQIGLLVESNYRLA